MNRILQRITALLDNLAPRERLYVSAAGVMVVISLVWFGLVQPLLDAGQRVGSRVVAAEQQLEVMRRLRREFDDVNHRLTAIEQRIQRSERGNLCTTLESLATRASVKIESMEPQSSPANERYRETKVEVGLREVSLPQTVRYLHEIEATETPLSVKALRIRTRSDKPELLDVTFTVSSFEPI